MTIWSKIFGSAGMEVADKVSEVVDKFVETPDEKKEFKKQMMQVFADSVADEQKNVTERWKSDMSSDSRLSKTVRPAVLIFLILSTIVLIFIDSGFINFVVDDEWKELLKLLLMTTVAAYFGGRSYEKGTRIKNK
jgi:cation transport ATPase